MLETITDQLNPNTSQQNAHRIAIDDFYSYNHNQNLDEFLESILNWSYSQFGTEQFISAKDEFFWKTGKVFTDDQDYNIRMEYFVDYFTFQRFLEGSDRSTQHQTPYSIYCNLPRENDNHPFIKDFLHSIFEVQKVALSSLLLKDLLTNEKIEVHNRAHNRLVGIAKKDLFQGFIYHCLEGSILSRGLIFHTRRVNGVIKKSIRKLRKSPDFNELKFLNDLAKHHLRSQKQQNLDPRVIYLKNS